VLLSVGNLHPRIVAQGKKICSALFLGESFLFNEVRAIVYVENGNSKNVKATLSLFHCIYIIFPYSFCFLWGASYIRSLFMTEKRCFTVSYFVTLAGTLYFALHMQSTPLTVLCAILQLIAMLSFLVSHIPGGTTGLMFFTRMFKSSVKSSLPV